MMDEAYRLVYRGEVLDGQHSAVVKKRLTSALKLSDDQAEKMFSGSAVVLKGHADTKTTARFQELFKKAGARLRVMAVSQDASEGSPAPENEAVQTAPAAVTQPETAAEPAVSSTDLQVSAVGGELLDAEERQPEPVAVAVPDFSVAEVGVVLVEPTEFEALDIDPQFDLADLGTDIPSLPVDNTPVVDISTILFEVADVGTDIGIPDDRPEADAPDISHLALVAE
jgi:hypothetical protein